MPRRKTYPDSLHEGGYKFYRRVPSPLPTSKPYTSLPVTLPRLEGDGFKARVVLTF